MKQLICEMCGGTDLIRDSGVFVCQTCGCKYSVEEAKRMMIEGTVSVSGTVQVDNSAFVQKYLLNARRAREKEDWEETEKYYNMVEQNDPNNIEAIFYSAYGKAKTTLVENDIYKRQAAFKVLANCISIVDDRYQMDRREENKEAIMSMAKDLAAMICSNFVYTEWKNGYGEVTRTNKGETYALFGTLLDAFKASIDNIEKIDDQPYLHEASILFYKVAQKTGIYNWNTLMQKWIDEEERELKDLQKKANEKYWAEHASEKHELNSEKNRLEAEIAQIKNEMKNLAEYKSVETIQRQMHLLKSQKNSLGIFKVKEKKAIQEQIDSLLRSLSNAKDKLAEAERSYNNRLDIIRKRITEINSIFSQNH